MMESINAANERDALKCITLYKIDNDIKKIFYIGKIVEPMPFNTLIPKVKFYHEKLGWGNVGTIYNECSGRKRIRQLIKEYINSNKFHARPSLVTVLGSKIPLRKKTGRLYQYQRYQCTCGIIFTSHIQGNRFPESCGCKKRVTHGMTDTDIYVIWQLMINRCENLNYAKYEYYGGRGITVCKEWHDFSVFYRDMGERLAGKTLDRKDNSKGYSKENCRWATRSEQNRNQRRNKSLTINGECKLIIEWSECDGATSRENISRRLKYSWTPEEAVFGRKQ